MAVLQELSDKKSVRIFPLEGNAAVVGRDDLCDIVIPSPAVSRMHAKIEIDGPRFFVLDLNSRNGTLLNGRRVTERELLCHGDVLDFSNNKFQFISQSVLEEESVSDVFLQHGPAVLTDSDDGDSSIYRQAVQQGDVVSAEVLAQKGVRDSRVTVQVSMRHGMSSPIVALEAARKLQASLRLVNVLQKVSAPEQLFPLVSDLLLTEFAATERVTVVSLQGVAESFHIQHVVSRHHNDLNYLCVPLIRYAVASQNAILYTDEWNVSLNPNPRIQDLSYRFLMCLPLFSNDDRCLAVIQLETSRKDRAFQAADLECLAVLGRILGMALQWQQNEFQRLCTANQSSLAFDARSTAFLGGNTPRPSDTAPCSGEIICRWFQPSPTVTPLTQVTQHDLHDGRQLFVLAEWPTANVYGDTHLQQFAKALQAALATETSVWDSLQQALKSTAATEDAVNLQSVAVMVLDRRQEVIATVAATSDYQVFFCRSSEPAASQANAVDRRLSQPSLVRYRHADCDHTLQLSQGDSLVLLNSKYIQLNLESSDLTDDSTVVQLLRTGLSEPARFEEILASQLHEVTNDTSLHAETMFALLHHSPATSVTASTEGPKGAASV